MARRTPIRDSAVGTTWRTVRSFLLFLLVVALVYGVFSVGVAIATANKCDTGGGHFNTHKTWDYMPPHWECEATFQGPG